ncbi:hypothetical protein TRAPUB_8011 [Trametes pubescens]|uniref:Uncharacterized protein n=1 Tax=Trametes pubescens TaxID=154538 RepID=A0A1M2W6H5_TRAPU|nr:hypothetical protein TRAPUB_8011 [Trametes pubescens]
MQHASSASSSKAPPGTIDFLPDLFARAHAAHPDFPLDHVIIQSLLLCLIAQPRSPSVSAKQAYDSAVRPGLHLILRTREEDVGLVVNLVALTLQHVLGVSTHKHKIGAHTDQPSRQRRRRSTGATHTSSHAPATDDPDAFLRALFFRRGPHPSFSSHRSSTPRPRSGMSLDATPKSGTVPLGGQAKSLRNVAHAPHRSASYPAAPNTDEEDEYFDASSLASSRRPLLPGHTPASTMRSRGSSRARPSAHRLRTDPLPLSSLFTLPGSEGHETPTSTTTTTTTTDSLKPQKSAPGSERASDSGQPVSAMPRAVVVSGLEHTALPAQRALMRVLTERRLIMKGYGGDHEGDSTEREVDADVEDGTWNLPDGFVMVYVCKWDPHERPPIQRGLLADLRMLARPYPTTGPIFYPSEHATMQPLPVLPLPPQPPPYAALHPSLETYLLDLFAATRHHPMLEGALLTQRAHADAEALARAFRVLNGDTLGTALIAQEAQLGGDRETAAAESFDDASWTEDGWRSVESLTRSARLKAEVLGVENGLRVRVNGDSVRSDGVSALSGMYGDGGGGAASPPEAQALAMARAWPEVWDVSEEDIARVFPRAVSHRLRVRDGPDDEVLGSVMWPAVPPEEGAAAAATYGGVDGSPQLDGLGRPMGWDRKSVKEILVRVLADV